MPDAGVHSCVVFLVRQPLRLRCPLITIRRHTGERIRDKIGASKKKGIWSSEPVSEPKFPASRENTGNFIDSGLGGRVNGGQKGHQISALRANSLRVRTGNFWRPYRELNRAIRVIFALIRESRSRPLFWHCPADVPTDLERRREGEQGRHQMLEVAEADLELRAGFV